MLFMNLPTEEFELRSSILSYRGYYPDALDNTNEDRLCIHAPFSTSANDRLFGVSHGHAHFTVQYL
jgi:hypothetical protein